MKLVISLILQYKLLVIFYLFVFQESIGESELVNLSTNYG